MVVDRINYNRSVCFTNIEISMLIKNFLQRIRVSVLLSGCIVSFHLVIDKKCNAEFVKYLMISMVVYQLELEDCCKSVTIYQCFVTVSHYFNGGNIHLQVREYVTSCRFIRNQSVDITGTGHFCTDTSDTSALSGKFTHGLYSVLVGYIAFM